MVSTSSLRKQIAAKRKLIALARKRQEDQLENIRLQQELDVLNRSPTTMKNIAFAQRTGRGFKKLAKIAKEKGARQLKRIQEQRSRDEARIGKRLKKGPEVVTVTKIITGKGKKRKVRVVRTKSKSKKTKSRPKESFDMQNEVFGSLDF